MKLIILQNQLKKRISQNGKQNKDKITQKKLAFQKLNIIYVLIEIMTTLTQYVSNLPKSFGKYFSTEINVEISQK